MSKEMHTETIECMLERLPSTKGNVKTIKWFVQKFHIKNNKHSTSYTIDRDNCYSVLQYIQLYTHIVVQRAYRIVCFVFVHTYGESFCIQAGKFQQRIPICCESLHMLYPQLRIDKFQVIKSSSVHDFQILLMVSTDSDKDCPAVYASCRLSSVMSECVCVCLCVFSMFSPIYIYRHRYVLLTVCSASSGQMLQFDDVLVFDKTAHCH